MEAHVQEVNLLLLEVDELKCVHGGACDEIRGSTRNRAARALSDGRAPNFEVADVVPLRECSALPKPGLTFTKQLGHLVIVCRVAPLVATSAALCACLCKVARAAALCAE